MQKSDGLVLSLFKICSTEMLAKICNNITIMSVIINNHTQTKCLHY